MIEKRLPPGQQLVGPEKWPFVGERESLPPPDVWTVTLTVAGQTLLQLTLEELKQLPTSNRTLDIHCVTRWSKLGVNFQGVSLGDLLIAAEEKNGCQIDRDQFRFVSFVAHTQRSHSTSLQLSQALDLGTLLAWEVDGHPLPAEHGGPLRNIVPGKYFYKSVKWLKQIDLLSEDRLGYWESDAGYHNHADPWKEERYLAANIDRREARRLMDSRDFSARDLRGIQVQKMELNDLNAAGALLRDAHFEGCRLQRANFRGANLSNAHFEQADLRDADFRQADLEGADFSGADLRGAKLQQASLFGASFVTGSLAAKLDSDCLSAEQLAALTDQQSAWVKAQ